MHDSRKRREEFTKESDWLAIDWARLARAVAFYEQRGYEKIEAPWLVEPQYREITYPHLNAFQTQHGDIVGSAEQSFLQLAFEGKISIKMGSKYVAITPCFRDHQPNDPLHQLYFMKVELFQPIKWGNSYPDLQPVEMLFDSGQFFASEGALPEKEETDEGIDWTVGGIEVGSYGYRVHDGFGWLYGTGLAEPRFSQALRNQRQHLAEKLPPHDERHGHT